MYMYIICLGYVIVYEECLIVKYEVIIIYEMYMYMYVYIIKVFNMFEGCF